MLADTSEYVGKGRLAVPRVTAAELKWCIKHLDARLDGLTDRLDAIQGDLDVVRSMLVGRSWIDPGFVSDSLGLTPGEVRVALMLAEGWTVKTIAEATQRSPSTVRWFLRQINRKLGVSSQAQMVGVVLRVAYGRSGQPPTHKSPGRET